MKCECGHSIEDHTPECERCVWLVRGDEKLSACVEFWPEEKAIVKGSKK